MKKTLLLLAMAALCCWNPVKADIESETADAWYEITDQELTGDQNGILWCAYNYQSVDPAGEPITLSAFMRIGSKWTTPGSNPEDLSNIVLMQHFTITEDSARPTNNYKANYNNNFGGNHLVIVPDHLGFGATADKHQAYLNHHLCAQNAYDALKAGYRIFRDKGSVDLLPGWQLYVAGASQGGGNALALHRYLEENDLDDDWRLAYSFICDGPYDPVQTLRTYQEWGGTTYPVVLPLIITAMREAYSSLDVYTDQDIYTPEYLAVKEEIEALIDAKKTSPEKISKQLIQKIGNGTSKLPIESIINADLLDETTEIGSTFLACLDDNNLINGWTPRRKVKLCYSTNDEVVPYSNTENLMEAFGDMVIPVTSHNSTHLATCMEWFMLAMVDFPYDESTITDLPAIDHLAGPATTATKRIESGRLIIERNGQCYDILGRK